MIFTTNKPLNEWGKVLHDEDLAAAILDRVLERGRFVRLDGPSGRTRHLKFEDPLPGSTERLRISGIRGSEFPEPTLLAATQNAGPSARAGVADTASVRHNGYFVHCTFTSSLMDSGRHDASAGSYFGFQLADGHKPFTVHFRDSVVSTTSASAGCPQARTR